MRILIADGTKACPCVIVDLNQTEEKLLNLTLNNPAAQGEFVDGIDQYINSIRAEIGDIELDSLQISQLHESLAGAVANLSETKIEIRPYTKTHILLSFAPDKFVELAQYLEAIRQIEGIEYEQGSNG